MLQGMKAMLVSDSEKFRRIHTRRSILRCARVLQLQHDSLSELLQSNGIARGPFAVGQPGLVRLIVRVRMRLVLLSASIQKKAEAVRRFYVVLTQSFWRACKQRLIFSCFWSIIKTLAFQRHVAALVSVRRLHRHWRTSPMRLRHLRRRAATHIACYLRTKWTREHFLRLRAAAVRISREYRLLHYRLLHSLIRWFKPSVPQIVTIQAFIRGSNARRRYGGYRVELKHLEEQQAEGLAQGILLANEAIAHSIRAATTSFPLLKRLRYPYELLLYDPGTESVFIAGIRPAADGYNEGMTAEMARVFTRVRTSIDELTIRPVIKPNLSPWFVLFDASLGYKRRVARLSLEVWVEALASLRVARARRTVAFVPLRLIDESPVVERLGVVARQRELAHVRLIFRAMAAEYTLECLSAPSVLTMKSLPACGSWGGVAAGNPPGPTSPTRQGGIRRPASLAAMPARPSPQAYPLPRGLRPDLPVASVLNSDVPKPAVGETTPAWLTCAPSISPSPSPVRSLQSPAFLRPAFAERLLPPMPIRPSVANEVEVHSQGSPFTLASAQPPAPATSYSEPGLLSSPPSHRTAKRASAKWQLALPAIDTMLQERWRMQSSFVAGQTR